MPKSKFKLFAISGRRYTINGVRVKKADFNRRRLKECFHSWRPLGCSEKDGFCRDCGLMVVNGKKVLSFS
jgi:hypothetical protein